MNTRDLRRRIKSIKNTAQITKAMQMVAASKMRKAQDAATAGHPYARVLNRVLARLSEGVDPDTHPLLAKREVHKELVLLLSTNKGLCGALNANLFREVMLLDAAKTDFVAMGKKGVQFLSRMKRNLIAEFPLSDAPSFLQTKTVSKFLIEKFTSAEVDKVSVLFPRFINTLTHQTTKITLLPLSGYHREGKMLVEDPAATTQNGNLFLFEPSPTQVLNAILPYYIHFEVYQMVLDDRAAGHSARMVAMKNATDNAKKLAKELTLEYNKARQAAITTELIEISTAQLAVE
ncbi:MAG: ATP synthase F1 subunit gamma [Verrucomicrobia bacterium]|nr:MAG: ATP synthase F1 subunit gamma [Verrucomicrobiota bacterium]